MKKKKSVKRNIMEWVIFIGVIAVIYFAGWHTSIIGNIQRLFLETGVKNASLNIPVAEREDADFSLKLFDDDKGIISLEEFRGKYILINLWATWCPPCRAEMPTLQNLYEEIDTSKVQFVMISLDRDPNVAKEFIEKYGYDFPSFRLAGNLPDVYESTTIPTTYIITPGGKIAAKEVGMANYDNDKLKTLFKDE